MFFDVATSSLSSLFLLFCLPFSPVLFLWLLASSSCLRSLCALLCPLINTMLFWLAAGSGFDLELYLHAGLAQLQ